MNDPLNSQPAPESRNPFEPPQTPAFQARVDKILIRPFSYPDEVADCSFFTYTQFADSFERKLVEAASIFNVDAKRDSELIPDQFTSVVRGRVNLLIGYHISGWDKFKQMVVPFLGYKYRAAGFEIAGVIESVQHEPIPFSLIRKFNRGRLAFGLPGRERQNMLVGMDAEANHVVSLALKRARKQSDAAEESSVGLKFWLILFLVPVLVAALCGLAVNQLSDVRPATRGIQTVLAAIAGGLWAYALLPSTIYRDSRLGFAYRLTAAKNALTLRCFPVIIASIVTALLVASIVLDE